MNSTDGSQAVISPRARLGRNVQVGYGTHIHGSAVIEDDCQIGDYCIIGHPTKNEWADKPLKIGRGSTIRSHSVLYEGSEFGPGLESGHYVLIREGTIAGPGLRVGSHSDIEGDCSMGDFCRFHSYVHVGRTTKIGHFVHLYSLTTLTNDPLPPSEILDPIVIEDGVVVCVGATIMPGTLLRRGCFVSANSVASGEIPPGAVVSGPQGQIVSHVSHLVNFQHGVRHPWMPNFAGRYPQEAQPRLQALQQMILADREQFIHTYLGRGA